VTAVDVSAVGLGRAAENAAEEGVELECVVADWRDYRSQVPIDLTVISFIHPKPEERLTMFAAFGEALAPGGHLFVVGVDLTDHGRRGPKDPQQLYTPDRLREALRGLQIVRCESVAYDGESTEGRRPVVDSVAIARRRP